MLDCFYTANPDHFSPSGAAYWTSWITGEESSRLKTEGIKGDMFGGNVELLPPETRPNLWPLNTNPGPANVITAAKQPTREAKAVVSQSKPNKTAVGESYQAVVSTHQEGGTIV